MSRLLQPILGLPGLRAVWIWTLRVRNEQPERRPTEVEPGVFVGGIATRVRWGALRSSGVTHAVSLLAEAPLDPWLAPADAMLWLPVPDRCPPSVEQLRAGCAFLDVARREGRGVFIYCGSGMGRAPTMYLAWRLRRHSENVSSALKVVHEARRVANPTRRQLEALEQWVR